MNKIALHILSALAMVALCGACSSELPVENQEGYGKVEFFVQSNDSRAVDKTYNVDDFQVSVKQGETVALKPQAYSQVKEGVLLKVGTGYQAYAESCSETEAESMNDGWGCVRYYGTSAPFSVVANGSQNVTLPCAIVNAAVSIQVDEEVATSGYALTLQANDNSSRTLTFNTTTAGKTAYFNVSDSRTIQYTLKIGDYSTSQSFVIQPKHTYTLDVHKQTNEEITVSIGVTVDDTVDEDTTEGTYNPYDKQLLNITE